VDLQVVALFGDSAADSEGALQEFDCLDCQGAV
jgi:hypothetical protein